jgi:hypothetical protein
VKLSKLCPKSVCGRNVITLLFFLGVTILYNPKFVFVKGYLSSSSYNHRKDWVFVHHAEVAFWSVYLCTMRGCFWSVYLCTMLRLLFDLCILLFDLCTLLEESTDVKFCWPSSTLVCVCAKVGCLWLCQSMRNFGINHKQSEHKLWHNHKQSEHQLFVKGDNGIEVITSEFHTFRSFFLALFSPVTIIILFG